MATFEALGLREEIVRAITDLGFETPTPIQEQAIPFILNSKDDLIALAQTGTGKTAAFSLPVLHQLDFESKKPQVLILSPTRELCLQIAKDVERFITHLKGAKVISVYGGESIDRQIKALKRGGQIIAGTPGRLRDLINRRKLDITNIDYLVLDEADEMLTMGFKDDLEAILGNTPDEKQTLLFSATRQDGIESMIKKFMHNPHEIKIGRTNMGAKNIEHQYYMTRGRDKYLALKRVLDLASNIYGIIFCRTRRETQEIADQLMQDGYNAEPLHGDLSQAQREKVMNRFRKKLVPLLVATDVAARGIDINDLNAVINYQLPDLHETYVHRSGRTGRAGKSGTAMSFITSRDEFKMKQIAKKIGVEMSLQKVPSGNDILNKMLFKYIDKIEKVEVNESLNDENLATVYQKLEWLNREELIKRLLALEMNRLLEYYENANDLNVEGGRGGRDRDRGRGRDRDRGRGRDRDRGRDRGRSRDRDRGRRNDRDRDRGGRNDRDRGSRRGRSGVEFTNFYFNLGSKKGIKPVQLIGLINDTIGKRGVEIGKIEILRNFSFVEIDSKHQKSVVQSFKNKKFNETELIVEPKGGK